MALSKFKVRKAVGEGLGKGQEMSLEITQELDTMRSWPLPWVNRKVVLTENHVAHWKENGKTRWAREGAHCSRTGGVHTGWGRCWKWPDPGTRVLEMNLTKCAYWLAMVRNQKTAGNCNNLAVQTTVTTGGGAGTSKYTHMADRNHFT